MNNIRLIVADIDGTITRNDRSTSQVNIDAIENCRKAGYIFGLASGRPIDDVINKYQIWNLDKQFDFIIAWNGCQLYDDMSKKSYEYNYLKKDELKEIIEMMSIFDPTINMYKNNSYLSNKNTEKAIFSAFKNKRPFVLTENINDYCDSDNGGLCLELKKN